MVRRIGVRGTAAMELFTTKYLNCPKYFTGCLPMKFFIVKRLKVHLNVDMLYKILYH